MGATLFVSISSLPASQGNGDGVLSTRLRPFVAAQGCERLHRKAMHGLWSIVKQGEILC